MSTTRPAAKKAASSSSGTTSTKPKGTQAKDESATNDKPTAPEASTTGTSAGSGNDTTPSSGGLDVDPGQLALLDVTVEPTEKKQKRKNGKVFEDRGFVYAGSLDPNRKLPRANLYLDEVERVNEERRRAAIEGREPDLDNPPAVQSTPLFSTDAIDRQLPKAATVEADVVSSVVVGTYDKDEKKS